MSQGRGTQHPTVMMASGMNGLCLQNGFYKKGVGAQYAETLADQGKRRAVVKSRAAKGELSAKSEGGEEAHLLSRGRQAACSNVDCTLRDLLAYHD